MLPSALKPPHNSWFYERRTLAAAVRPPRSVRTPAPVYCLSVPATKTARRRRGRRKRHANVGLWRLETEQQHQEHELEAQRSRQLQAQLYVSCINDQATAASVQAFFERWGVVQDVSLKVSQHNQTQRAARSAVIQFENPATAQSILRQREDVQFFDGRPSRRRNSLQLALRSDIGYLKSSSCPRCRGKAGITCPGCPTYCKVGPNRTPRVSSYQKGSAGEVILSHVNIKLGSLGSDGISLVEEEASRNAQVQLHLQQRCLIIETQLGGSSGSGKYRLLWPFRHVIRSMQLNRQSGTITFTARAPPKVLTEVPVSELELQLGYEGPSWQLGTDPTTPGGMPDVPDTNLVTRLAARLARVLGAATEDGGPIMAGSGLAGADGLLGRCWTVLLQLDADARLEHVLDPGSDLVKKLRSFRLLAPGDNQLRGSSSTSSSQQLGLLSLSHYTSLQRPCDLKVALEQLDFLVGYWVLVLLSGGTLTTWQVSQSSFLGLMQQHPTPLVCQALEDMAQGAGRLRDSTSALQRRLQDLMDLGYVGPAEGGEEGSIDAEGRLFKVLRVHVTPTRVKFMRPEPQTGHRVIRHFSNPDTALRSRYPRHGPLSCLNGLVISSSHFLRVSFGDEHGDRLFTNREEPVDVFYNRMKRVMLQGVMVNGRHYMFVAYSSSQLKTWSCWMVADPRQGQPGAVGAAVLADALRHWMGDAMTALHVPAKCAARLGQCFSSTVDAARVEQHQVMKIADVERNGYCFSDGVGCISAGLLDDVLQVMQPFRTDDDPPVCAIQIRLQGCKGVLSRNSQLRGRLIQVRPSMDKFGSSHPQLEVCSVASWLPAYLNRQVIIMMVHNGVREQVLLNKLEVLLTDLALMCHSSTEALRVLPHLGAIESTAHRAMVQMLDAVSTWRLPQMMGPLLDSCIRAVARWQVTDLRNKARLLVRDGTLLVGVMDEFGVLQEGEVFVQIQQPRAGNGNGSSNIRRSNGSTTQSQPVIITGSLMLAKHPVAHRGDVRRVQGVDPGGRWQGQLLRDNYVNVVVFSQQGERPLTNMLSGSDLDGDQYMVLWDQELLQPANQTPMDYTAEKPIEVDTVTVDHLAQHFVDFAKNDNLGKISNWLLAHADKKGADCRECERLAQLHSQAVDFPKTGRPATISMDEIRQLVPQEYPHWMNKPDRTTYQSDTVLGKMYDRVLKHPLTTELLEQRLQQEQGQHIQQQQADADSHAAVWLKRLSAWRQRDDVLALRGDAREACRLFVSDLLALMNAWHVYDVGEVLTCCLPRLQVQRAQGHQQSEQRDQLAREMRGVWHRARHHFISLVFNRAFQLQGRAQLEPAQYAEVTLKELEKRLADSLRGPDAKVVAGARDAVAAAYLLEAHRAALSRQRKAQQQQQQHRKTWFEFNLWQQQQRQHSAVLGPDDDGDDSEASSYDSEDDEAAEDFWANAEEGVGEAGGPQQQQLLQHRRSREDDLDEMIQLSFQFVVAKELKDLSQQLQP